MILEMCYLDIKLVHDITEVNTVDGPELTDEVKVWNISNTELDIDFNMVTGIDVEDNRFDLTIWNYPYDLELGEGDYVFAKFYWRDNENRGSPEFIGIVSKIEEDHSAADTKVSITCSLLRNYLFKTKKVQSESTISTLGEYFELVSEVGIKDLQVQLPDITLDTTLKLIAINGLTFVEIGRKLREAIEVQYGIDISWRIDNKDTIVFYDPKEEKVQIDVEVPVIDREEIFKLKQTPLISTTRRHDIYIEAFGIPTLEVGKFIMFDDRIYLIEEIEHIIDSNTGYNMKLYAYANIPQPDEEDIE